MSPANHIAKICRAVLGLKDNTAGARQRVYDSVRDEIVANFRTWNPAASEAEVARLQAVIDDEIRNIESIARASEKAASEQGSLRKTFRGTIIPEDHPLETAWGGSDEELPEVVSPVLEKTTMGNSVPQDNRKRNLQPETEIVSSAARFVDEYLNKHGRELSLSEQKKIFDTTGPAD